MGTPQIIYIVLTGISLLSTAYLHGQPKTGKHNIFYTIIGTALTFGLLYWGGFF